MECKILKPCHRTWSSLEGTSSARYCKECQQTVYEIIDQSDAEIQEMHYGREQLCLLDARPVRRSFLLSAAAALPLGAQDLRQTTNLLVAVTDISGARVVGRE